MIGRKFKIGDTTYKTSTVGGRTKVKVKVKSADHKTAMGKEYEPNKKAKVSTTKYVMNDKTGKSKVKQKTFTPMNHYGNQSQATKRLKKTKASKVKKNITRDYI
jgi:hypothetical protein